MLIRTLTFQQISDSRFGGSESELKALTDELTSILSKLSGVRIQLDDSRVITFSETQSKSCRRRFFIQKTGKATTWNDIFKVVNHIKPTPYDFINQRTSI